MSTLSEVAHTFVELCKQGKNIDALNQLYADDAISIEAMECPEMERIAKGKEALIAKNTWWIENHEVHSVDMKGPFLHTDNSFACTWKIDVTYKPGNKRCEMEEVGVFTLNDGKITEERYFYTMPE